MRKIPHLIIAGYLFYMIKNKKEVDRNMEEVIREKLALLSDH
jgi:hypothetical protein